MKSIALSAAAISTIVSPILASDLKVVNVPNLKLKPRVKASNVKFLQTRAGTDQVTLANQRNLYAINLNVGTPAQNISVQIDTGSSDLWFPVTGSQLCKLQLSTCDSMGSYDPNSSSSVQSLGQSFSISYGDGTQIEGQFVTDNVQIGSSSLSAVQLAACDQGSSQTGIEGILGVGYETNEASAASGTSGTYPNLLASMQKQGVINTLAYSLWLNDLYSADGNILFGGVDLAKFSGTLVSMPVVPDSSGGYSQLTLPLTGVSFSADGQSFTYTPSNFLYPALVDSGTTLMYLPDALAKAIYESLGVVTKQDTPLLPCNYGNDGTAKVTFTFNGNNGANIDVFLDDLLAPVDYTFSSGEQACEFLLSGGATDGLVILGDSFMRSAYLVYDLTNNMIGIAQTKFNETSSNIKEIDSNGIPSASVMSTLVGSASVASTGGGGLPGATGFATTGGVTGGVESSTPVPTFHITATTGSPHSTHNAAPGSARPISAFSIVGVLAGTISLLSVFGGAMIIWL